jgi:hypothetical protein
MASPDGPREAGKQKQATAAFAVACLTDLTT